VLALCGKAGLVRAGVVAFDGTKLSGNAHRERNLDYGQIAREIIEQALATDEQQDEELGDARGDELPEELSTDEGRRAWLARELAAKSEADDQPAGHTPAADDAFDPELIVARGQGRDGWIREAKRRLDDDRTQTPSEVPRSREQRLWNAGQRLSDDLDAARRGQQAWERWRATATDSTGRRLPRRVLRQPPATPDGAINLTDPDTQLMMGHKPFVQGYNAQAVVSEDQIVLAAEISTRPGDFSHLRPMLAATHRELEQAGIAGRPQVALADAGFWNEQHMDDLAGDGITVLIPPDAGNRKDERPGWTGGRYSWMRQLLKTDPGSELYRKRRVTIEPVFGHTKHNRKFTQFHRRGRGGVRTEWRLLIMTHNLTKLHRHQLATAGP
jgi:hypothetical protein